MKKKVDEYSKDRKLLHGLLSKIRDGNDEQVAQLVSVIRSNVPLSEVKTILEEQCLELDHNAYERNSDLELPESEGSMEQSHTRRRTSQEVLQISHLINN